LLVIGYSLLEGIGSALMIPPIYILATVMFTELESRSKALGIISASAGLGAAAGPLIGGVITSAINWRASFWLQVLVVAGIFVMARRLSDPGIQGAKPAFDIVGAILSAVGLLFVVIRILSTFSQAFPRKTRARFPDCRGAFPTWAPRSARRWSGPCW
jgi:MFS family permease